MMMMMIKRVLLLSAFMLTSCRAFQTPSAPLAITPKCESQVMYPVAVTLRRRSTIKWRKATPSRTSLPTTTQLDSIANSSSDDNKASSFNNSQLMLDRSALLKYAIAIVTQCSLFYSLFTALDMAVAQKFLVGQKLAGVAFPTTFLMNFFLFYFVALKSRVLNPLSNKRPKVDTLEVSSSSSERRRLLPSWTPPGPVFPIVWLLLVGPLRAIASCIVYQVTGKYACLPIMSLILHLSIGDVWNTINNVERRYGVSVPAIYLVWLSKAHAAYRYGQVSPLAGKLLGATLIWLTIASALITATWRLNPNAITGDPEPWYPTKGRKTRFAWFSKK